MPVADSVTLGKDVRIFQPSLVNLYGCAIVSSLWMPVTRRS